MGALAGKFGLELPGEKLSEAHSLIKQGLSTQYSRTIIFTLTFAAWDKVKRRNVIANMPEEMEPKGNDGAPGVVNVPLDDLHPVLIRKANDAMAFKS